MLKIHHLSATIKNFFHSLNIPQLKSIIFYGLYIIMSVLFIFVFPSIWKGMIASFVIVLFWKIVVGLSWLNFCYLLLGYLEIATVAYWFKPLWLAVLFVLLLVLFFKKIITDNKKSSLFLSYFIATGWILLSYGLYFYRNQPFFLSFIVYFLGLLLISFLNFLNLDKEISINYLIYLLINLEAYCLFALLSLNGLQFGTLILFLQYFLLTFT
ncbi:MAG: hypothetical protein GYA31_01730 [Parcubacteria group bacterium]|nr:hypothetical protein [Parcubacteria group bacterium]